MRLELSAVHVPHVVMIAIEMTVVEVVTANEMTVVEVVDAAVDGVTTAVVEEVSVAAAVSAVSSSTRYLSWCRPMDHQRSS